MTVTRFAVDLGVLPVALDLGGTFVFALSGAAAGVKHRLDVFGVLALSLAAASSGGIVRASSSAPCPRRRSATGGTSRSRPSPKIFAIGGRWRVYFQVPEDRLTALYRQYGQAIYWRCLKILGDEAAAEDATQETFLRVQRHLDRAPDVHEAGRWILRIATNYCLNAACDRRRIRETRDELPDVPMDVGLEQLLSDRDMVRRVVGRVDEKLRAVAWAHYVDGLDHVEAARMLGVSRRTVANRLAVFEARARKVIRRTS